MSSLSLSGIGQKSDEIYNQPPKKKELNKALTVAKEVLFSLDDRDIQHSLVSRDWNVIDTAKYEEFSGLKSLARDLNKNLPESYENQKKKFFNIESDTKILHSENLMQAESCIYGMKEKILNILKDLKEEDLKNLERLSKDKPKFFENVFDLTRIYKRLDQANQIPDNSKKSFALWCISNELAKIGSLDKARKVANTIPEDSLKNSAFSKILGKDVGIDEAIEVPIA